MATIMEAKVRLFDVYAFLMRQLVNLARFMMNSSHRTLDDVWKLAKCLIPRDMLTTEPRTAAKIKEVQHKSRVDSFQALVKYCEQTDRCRHMVIGEFFGEEEVKACDRACDFCMEGEGLKRRKRDGLASEEWVSTQRERNDFYEEGYD